MNSKPFRLAISAFIKYEVINPSPPISSPQHFVRNRSEAQKALKIIQYNFPKAFIKPDMINLADLD